MSAMQVIEAMLKADGTLELAGKLNLPPGQVRITVESLAPTSAIRTELGEIFEQIRKAQAARGYSGRAEHEMRADEAASSAEDEEYEARWRAIHAQTAHPLPHTGPTADARRPR